MVERPGEASGGVEHVQKCLAAAFSSALDERLVALVAYGSSVDESFIPGFSDFDLAVFLHGELGGEDTIAVQSALGNLNPAPFAYLQTKLVDVDAAPAPALVQGSFSVFWGELPADPAYLHDDDSLRQAGAWWAEALPRLVAEDRAAWSVAAGSSARQRLVRLMMTRLKPAVRSLLVELGEPPGTVWSATWSELAKRWRGHDPDVAARVGSVLAALPPEGRGQEVELGAEILRLLTDVRAASGG